MNYDDDSSSGDDLPLSALGRGKRARPPDDEEMSFQGDESSEDAEFDDNNDGDGGYNEEDADGGSGSGEDNFIDDDDGGDDDDDYTESDDSDTPLSSLKTPVGKKSASSPKKPTPKAKVSPKKKASSAKKKKSSAKKSATKKKSNGSNGIEKSMSRNPAVVLPSMELYEKCDKGKLIRSVLARWWYAYEWPDPTSFPVATPKKYDAMDGFPGVYICTQGGNVGLIKDFRDHAKAPCFRNFVKMSANELQEMLLKAIKRQRQALEQFEGEKAATCKDLRALEKWADRLNCNRADKDAVKVLKASRLSLS